MDNKDMPIWKFDKIKITQIQPYYKDNHEKSHENCYITINFGFFIVFDIGISYDIDFGLSWSHDFGWSRFKFLDSYIENPYGDDVRKLEVMVKNEMENKKDEIVSFLKSSSTMPELLIDEGSVS